MIINEFKLFLPYALHGAKSNIDVEFTSCT